MDRYYKRNRSRSPRSRNQMNSSGNRIELPEFIPLVSSTQHSDSDIRPKSSRDRRASPSPRRVSRERSFNNSNNNGSTKSTRRRISPPPIDNPISPHRRRKERRSHSHSPQQHSPRRSSNRSRTNSSERTNRSVFNRLGVPTHSQRTYSPINFEDYPRNSPTQSYSNESSVSNRPMTRYRGEIDFEPVRIIVKNDNYQGNSMDGFNSNRHVTANDVQAEIIYAIRQLEKKNSENLQHIYGVRTTVENYQREIYKLEQIVDQNTHEIERLKARLNSIV